jgi:putative zinc finger/helix-turn-helix YgiT family protein
MSAFVAKRMKPEKEILTRKCEECGRMMEGRRENYHYTECGLQSVFLKHILVFHCECGAIVARIPAVANLHRAILFSLIKKDSLLSGEEIRFLRKIAALDGSELAQALGIHKATLSKWENGKRQITKASDGALRLLCYIGMVQKLNQEKDQFPEFAEAIRQLSLVDINDLLQKIRETLEGPKNIRIDPEELSLFGYPEHSQRVEMLQ